MEKIATWDKNTVMCELNQGRELANELKRKLHTAVGSISRDQASCCGPLMEKILSSYDNALSLLNCSSSMALLGNIGQGSDPDSIENSPRSEESDPVFKDHVPSKKRKTMPRWSEQVRVRSDVQQLEDGYNWRKYGQKDILGANHPRAYYRCTYRPTQGCLATKQVQKTDADPSIFDVIYRGNHSCSHERLKQNKENFINILKNDSHSISNETFLKVETQELDDDFKEEEIIHPFSFPSTPIQSENVEVAAAAQFFSPDLFLSPATSDISFFSPSPSNVNDCFGMGHIFQNLEYDFSEIISNSTSMTDFQFGELDFLIDQVDFESDFIYGADYLS